MKSAVLGFAILLLGATSSKTVKLTTIILRSYTSWNRITPPSYSVPGHLSILCTRPAHPGEIVEDREERVPVRVFANDLALKALHNHDPFPIGAVFVKEKKQSISKEETFDFGSSLDDNLHQGIMIKSKKGWEFSYFPHSDLAAYEACNACHKTADHDFVFTPYLKKK